MGRIDFTVPEVWILFIGLTAAILIFIGVLFLLLRVLKLYIPGSKLSDDYYIKCSVRNTTRLRKVSVLIFILQVILLVFNQIGILHLNIIDGLFFWGPFFIIMELMLLIGLGPLLVGRRYFGGKMRDYFDGTDIIRQVSAKRIIKGRKRRD